MEKAQIEKRKVVSGISPKLKKMKIFLTSIDYKRKKYRGRNSKEQDKMGYKKIQGNGCHRKNHGYADGLSRRSYSQNEIKLYMSQKEKDND